MPPPKKTDPRPYERSAKPLEAPPAPKTVWALAIVPHDHMGQPQHSIVAFEITGSTAVAHPIPESNYERMEQALQDLRSCAMQGFRFRKWAELIAGRA